MIQRSDEVHDPGNIFTGIHFWTVRIPMLFATRVLWSTGLVENKKVREGIMMVDGRTRTRSL